MNMNTRTMYIRMRSAGIAVFGAALYTTPVVADDFTALARLAAAQGEQYVQQRDTLLETHPQPWDVRAASEDSWESGLAAFTLNQRMQERDAFAMLDDQFPILRANGHCYELSMSHDANVAFLLEKMWKAPATQRDGNWTGTPGRESERAYGTLIMLYGNEIAQAGDAALWKSMWQNCEDERFRFAAVYYLCAAPDSSVQTVIEDILQSADDRVAGYSAKSHCLSGLQYRNTGQTVDAVFGALEVLKRDGKMGDAVGVLAANENGRARRLVHEFILGPENDETLRGEALAKCCNRPRADDVEIMRRFFAGPVGERVKTNALASIGRHCPLDQVRPVFREVLIQSDDPKMIASAALALDSAYILAKEVDEAARAEDITLLEGVRTREGLTNATRVHIGMYIERLRGNPNPRLPDRPARDR